MRNVSFCIDRGGTFTDVFATNGADGSSAVLKLLSEDPANYADAPTEGIRRMLEKFTGESHPREGRLDTTRIASIRMGTTVATNALLERKGERFALMVTKGFGDVLAIGNQARPKIFDLEVKRPGLLYSDVVEVDERVILVDSVLASGREARSGPNDENLVHAEPEADGGVVCEGVTGERVQVRQPLDTSAVRKQLEAILASGISSIAVVLMHAAIWPEHERAIGALAEEVGFKQVSLSYEVMSMVKLVPRGFTACADAYLTPHIARYLHTFVGGFDDNLVNDVKLCFMQSDGGLAPLDRFSGHRAILSGPAGGVVGYARTASEVVEHGQAIIGFDMGGTSTDVSRCSDEGQYEHVHETTTAGVTIQAPQLDIATVAAGGGSRLFFQNGLFVVGPESVGANPGPVSYRKGGQLAITDANLVLGRIIVDAFPKIFGPNEDESLDVQAASLAFQELTDLVNQQARVEHAFGVQYNDKSMAQVALGFVTVANETMCRPIRELTQMKGHDITKHMLACFGGAGGQHACAIARNLGMSTVFVHRYSGILSAYGMGLADVVEERQEPSAQVLDETIGSAARVELVSSFDRLAEQAKAALVDQGISEEAMRFEFFLNLRYQGTDSAIMVSSAPDVVRATDGKWDYRTQFEAQYKREFGFAFEERVLLVDDTRVRAVGLSDLGDDRTGQSGDEEAVRMRGAAGVASAVMTNSTSLSGVEVTSVFFEQGGWLDTPVYGLASLTSECVERAVEMVRVDGPALLLDATSTILVEPACRAHVLKSGDVFICVDGNEDVGGENVEKEAEKSKEKEKEEPADPILLSVFSHRFMGIAEQMGRTLQRTSMSVNIKERLDFSCALFAQDGGLISNAPHIPVHLGAMQEAVKAQINYWNMPGRPGIQDGDVLVSNHPQLAGGSHLPDITVMTPVFNNNIIVFWVASRGHHADIGGIAPGSMPPMSKLLADEGAAIVAFKLVQGGIFREKEISEQLTAKPIGGSSASIGTRCLADNLSDLRAQVAANTRGIHLVADLIVQYGLKKVQAYMDHIMNNAEGAVREMLKAFGRSRLQLQNATANAGANGDDSNVVSVHASDRLDDGSVIALKIDVNLRSGDAVFDFTGTGEELWGNLNAPPAVTYSAVIYCMRCLVGQDIPLNQGCLRPVKIIIPDGSLLHPSPEAGVVGGNVLTSQRVVDVVLKAFNACAASQGCMNNLTFGDDAFGYYETIAGGAGAGPTWNGSSGVHTHMTNTRITDPEILERRYPVVVREFSLRPESGGAGLFNGGQGVVRDLEFRRPLTLSILSERRVLQPYGLEGGAPGACGHNMLMQKLPFSDTTPGDSAESANPAKKDQYLRKNLGGKNTVDVNAGDRIRIRTPGGGGYGAIISPPQ